MEIDKLYSYHKFQYGGNIYLLNIEKMLYGKISKSASHILNGKSHNIPPTPEVIEEFKKLKLFKDEEIYQKESSCISKDFFRETTDIEGKNNPSVFNKDTNGMISAVNLFITQTCNMNCTYCYGEGGEYGKKSHMTEDCAMRSVDWLIKQSKDKKDITIGFFGGEPLLNVPLIKKVVSYGRKKTEKTDKKIKFGVLTNGTLLKDEYIKYFKENDINIQIGFDGPKEVQDRQRPFKNSTDSSYDSTVPKIKKLLKSFPNTTCRATFCGNDDPARVIEGIKNIGFKKYHLVPASKPLPGEEKTIKSSHKKTIEAMKRFIEDEAKEFLEAVKRREGDKIKELKGSVTVEKLSPTLKKRYFSCGAGKNFAAISTSGDIYLCHRFAGLEEFKIGSIYENTLQRDVYLKSPVEGEGKCSLCWAKYFCGGGCMYEHFSATGSIFRPDENMCKLRKLIAKLSIHLYSLIDRSDIAWLEGKGFIPQKPCYLDIF